MLPNCNFAISTSFIKKELSFAIFLVEKQKIYSNI